MVVKLASLSRASRQMFESSVISYGSQTYTGDSNDQSGFESSVISYGSQTRNLAAPRRAVFESSVISYGSQTRPQRADV